MTIVLINDYYYSVCKTWCSVWEHLCQMESKSHWETTIGCQLVHSALQLFFYWRLTKKLAQISYIFKAFRSFSQVNSEIIITDRIKEEYWLHLWRTWLFMEIKWTDTDRCDIFEQIAPELLGKVYTLRELDTHGHPDFSLSRCALRTEARIAVIHGCISPACLKCWCWTRFFIFDTYKIWQAFKTIRHDAETAFASSG